jgi:hypothetical protein
MSTEEDAPYLMRSSLRREPFYLALCAGRKPPPTPRPKAAAGNGRPEGARYHPAVDDDPELQRQRAEIEEAFRERWAPPREPQVLTEHVCAAAGKPPAQRRQIWLDRSIIEAVRDGARPGDPLPPRRPGTYLDRGTDAEVFIIGHGPGRRVAVEFSHEDFPYARFGHRFGPEPSGGRSQALRLMELIEAGALHRMMDNPPPADSAWVFWTTWGTPNSDPELEHQRAQIEEAFRHGWRSPDDGLPRVLTEPVYAQARRLLGRGGWTGLDQATIQAVRDGARPGDPLPPLQPRPYITGVTDTEVIVTGAGPGRCVAVLFCHEGFPGARFGHRFPLEPYGEGHEKIWLMEEIDTGALHRMMRTDPAADSAGVIWTTWGNPVPD